MLNNFSHPPGITYALFRHVGGNFYKLIAFISKENGHFNKREIEAFVRLHLQVSDRIFVTDGCGVFNFNLCDDILQIYDEFHFILNFVKFLYPG